jgi:hypothetical protein
MRHYRKIINTLPDISKDAFATQKCSFQQENNEIATPRLQIIIKTQIVSAETFG